MAKPKTSEEKKAYYEVQSRIGWWARMGFSAPYASTRQGLTAIPSEVEQLQNVLGLSFAENRIIALPPELFRLKGLPQLSLSNNQLTSLPSAIAQLQALQTLYLSNNQLTSLPPELGLLRDLRELSLSGNQLVNLPPELGQLKALRELEISNNQLTSLPPELGQLRELRELSLSGNQLSSLPPEVGQLKALEQLSLSGNLLTTLPTELGQLDLLKELSLSGNQLTSLPPELRNLSKLSLLFLHGNPALGLPPEVLGPTWEEVVHKKAKPASPQAILDYYFSRLAQGQAPMQEVRLLMVGRGRVGKTTLLKVLRGEKADTGEKETPGITVLPLDLACTQGTARAHTWDFGGQEFLHGTHQIFLSERCVYVLVLEGRDGNWESETDYWLRFIQSFGGDSPVVVALNKFAAHAFSVDRFRLQERCPQIVGFVETDAFTGLGIGELRGLLERTVNGMEHVWVGVPKRWHRVKEALAKTAESFLEYAAYQALCAKEGVAEERQQESLAETLHRLGIALNFRDHHRLKHTSVLKPQWVTEGIYGLLRFAQAKVCDGVLQRAWVDEALAAVTAASRKAGSLFQRLFGGTAPVVEYPPDKHAFVLELMEKFEVAFPLEQPGTSAGQPQEPQRWLIPELLPEVQPAEFKEFRGAGVKRLRFTYPQALPPGLLPRFIVRTHELSEVHTNWRWRSGVVLEWGAGRALVRLDRAQRRTEVEVLGGNDDERQSLFDIIRSHLTTLHGKVPVVEEVQALDDPEKWIEMRELRMAERDQDESIKVVVGTGADEKRVKVPVVKTLNDVQSPESREADGPHPLPRMRLFVSYAHLDERKLKPLSMHLNILGSRGYIQAWDDTQLVAGEEWEARIFSEMGQADIILMVYSNASCASKFIREKEAPEALRLAKANGCTLIVVPLDRKGWDATVALDAALKKLQTATRNATPVHDYRPHTKGWTEIEQAIRQAVEARRKMGR